MNPYFITGTGTDIGKTFILCELCKALQSQGKNVHAIKPVMSGVDDIQHSDAAHILKSVNIKPTQDNIDKISPWQFNAALAPNMAAKRENRQLDFDEIYRFCQQERYRNVGYDNFFIEGVGGVMSPLTDTSTNIDLIESLAIPAILIAGVYLGTISHTLTAVESLLKRNIKIKIIILNALEPVEEIDEIQACISKYLTSIPVVKTHFFKDPATSVQSLLELL